MGLYDLFFSPLTKNSCSVFLTLTIFTFITFILNIIFFIGLTLSGKFKFDFIFYLLNSYFQYYIFRVLYSICINSLK